MAKRQINSTSGTSKEKSTGKSTTASKNPSVGTLREQQTHQHSEPKEKKTQQAPKKITLSQDQISKRAKEIWQQRGCPSGEDERNWLEAENQLKQELNVR